MNDPQPYELTFEERPGYLYAKIKADTIDRSMGLAYLTAIAKKCAAVKSRRVLIDREIPVMLSPADLYFLTNEFLQRVRRARVAFVNPHASLKTEMDFAMLIGTNRGANFIVAADVVAAEKWLLN